MGRADTYSQPEAPDPVLPADVVLGLARVHVPSATRLLGVDESGGEARVYFLDGDVVVKAQRPHRLRPRTSLAKEAHMLEALAVPLATHVPRLFGYDEVDTDVGRVEFIVMSRMPGTATRHVEVKGAARSQLLAEVGRALRSVHCLDVAALRDTGLFPAQDDATALRRRLELGFADIVDAMTECPSRWQ